MSPLVFFETKYSLRCEVLPGVQTTLVPSHALAHGLAKSLGLSSNFSIRLDLLASHFVVRTLDRIADTSPPFVYVSGGLSAAPQRISESQIKLGLDGDAELKVMGDFCAWYKAPKDTQNERFHSVSKRSLPKEGRETLVFQRIEPHTGRPRALVKDETRLRWLFERNGFLLPSGSEALEDCLEFIPPFSLSPDRARAVSITAHGAFRFRGKLKITNRELASKALVDGLGSRRSYAFGCLQLESNSHE